MKEQIRQAARATIGDAAKAKAARDKGAGPLVQAQHICIYRLRLGRPARAKQELNEIKEAQATELQDLSA